MISTVGICAKDVTGKMEHHQFQRRAVGASDVHIKIKYSGICHSDIHTAKGDWGPKSYPLCVGHEILGDVVAVGADVTNFKVGDVLLRLCTAATTTPLLRLHHYYYYDDYYCYNNTATTPTLHY